MFNKLLIFMHVILWPIFHEPFSMNRFKFVNDQKKKVLNIFWLMQYVVLWSLRPTTKLEEKQSKTKQDCSSFWP